MLECPSSSADYTTLKIDLRISGLISICILTPQSKIVKIDFHMYLSIIDTFNKTGYRHH